MNDHFGLLESTILSGATVPNSPEELRLLRLGQDFPVGSGGLHVGYQLGVTDSTPGGALDALEVDVSSFSTRFYGTYPILRTIARSVVASVGLDTQETELEVASVRQTRDRYRWLTFGLEADQDIGFGSVLFEPAYMQGLEIFDATERGEPLASRQNAAADFHVLAASAELALGPVEGVGLLGRGTGQYGFDPLPSVAQMSFGGEPFGRAFDSSVASGDSGIAGALELTLQTEPAFAEVRRSLLYTFLDFGVTWFRGDDRTDRKATFASTGIGFRAVLDPGFAVDASIGVPLRYEDDVIDRGARFFFSVKKRF